MTMIISLQNRLPVSSVFRSRLTASPYRCQSPPERYFHFFSLFYKSPDQVREQSDAFTKIECKCGTFKALLLKTVASQATTVCVLYSLQVGIDYFRSHACFRLAENVDVQLLLGS